VTNQPAQPILTYLDRPEVSETFADSLGKLTLEGFNAKLEFVVNRMDNPSPPNPPTGKAVPICRLVLPFPSIVDLHAKLGALISLMQAQGAVNVAPFTPPGKPN
jgi:hypothetical protein